MTLITFEDGKAVFRDGKVGTEQACCCGGPPDPPVCEGECTVDAPCVEGCVCNYGQGSLQQSTATPLEWQADEFLPTFGNVCCAGLCYYQASFGEGGFVWTEIASNCPEGYVCVSGEEYAGDRSLQYGVDCCVANALP